MKELDFSDLKKLSDLHLKTPGSGHNDSLLTVACEAFRLGYSHAETLAHLEGQYEQGRADSATAPKRAVDRAWEMKGVLSSPDGASTRKAIFDPEKLESFDQVTPEQVKESSPDSVEDLKPRDIIEKLFKADDLICIEQVKDQTAKVIQVSDLPDGLDGFKYLNPSTFKRIEPSEGSIIARNNSNVLERRFMVLENDTEPNDENKLSKKEALEIRQRFNGFCITISEFIPLVMAVDTGGKSIHFWFDCPDGWTEETRKVFAIACEHGADKRMGILSQKARMPNVSPAPGRRAQKLLYFDPARCGTEWDMDGLLEELFRREKTTLRKPFPIDAFPPVMAGIVRETMKAALVPDSLAAMAALGCVSASIGAGLCVKSGGSRMTRGNLFILGIAPSGTGKGNAFKEIFKPFREAENNAIAHFQDETLPRLRVEQKRNEWQLKAAEKRFCEMPPYNPNDPNDPNHADEMLGDDTDDGFSNEDHAENEMVSLQKKKDEIERRMSRPEGFSVADVTKEKLALALSEMPLEALASISPEGRGVIDVLTGRYSKTGNSSDEDIYLSGFSGESYTMSRINRPTVRLREPCLSILWMIQPDVAKKFTSSDTMMTSGLIPRFLLADTHAVLEDEPENPHVIDLEIENDWRVTIQSLLGQVRTRPETATVETAEGVHAAIRKFTNEGRQSTRNGRRAGMESVVARWGEQAWRIALVLHAGTHGAKAENELVSVATAENAIKITRWFIQQQEAFLEIGKARKFETAAMKLQKLLVENEGLKTIRDLKRHNKYDEDGLKDIVEKNPHLFKIEKTGDIGRPSQAIILLEPDKIG